MLTEAPAQNAGVPPAGGGAASAVRWTVLGRYYALATNLLVYFILARLLEPIDFGLVSVATIFVSLTQPLVNQGFGAALVQRQKIEPGHVAAAFFLSVATGLVALGLGWMLAQPLADWFTYFQALQQSQASQPLAEAAQAGTSSIRTESVATLVRWFAVCVALSPLAAVPLAVLQRELRFREMVLCNAIARTAATVAGVGLALAGYGVWSFVGMMLTESISAAVARNIIAPWAPPLRFAWRHVRDLWGYGAGVSGAGLLQFFNSRADDILIAIFLGPVALSYYSVAYRMFQQLSDVLVSTMNQVAFAMLSRNQHDPDWVASRFLMATRLTFSAAAPVMAVCAVVAEPLIVFVLGEKYLPSVLVLRLLLGVGAMYCILVPQATVLQACGRSTALLRFHALNTCLNLFAFAVAVRFGIEAVALAFLIRSLVVLPILLRLVVKHTRVTYPKYLQALAGPLLCLVGCVAAAWLLLQALAGLPSGVRMAAPMLAGLFTYAAMLRAVAPHVFHEFAGLVKRVLLPRLTGMPPKGSQQQDPQKQGPSPAAAPQNGAA